MGIEPTPRIELPLWGNIILGALMVGVLGKCYWDLFYLWYTRDKKERK